jgi:hypothetical protein
MKSILSFKTLWWICQLIVIFMLAACSGPVPTMSTVKGRYIGSYGGGEEIIELNGDGTFSQTLSVGGKEQVRNTGKWSVEGAEVKLENFVEFFDVEFKKLRLPPKKFGSIHCMWTTNPDQLVFDYESGYIASKKKL